MGRPARRDGRRNRTGSIGRLSARPTSRSAGASTRAGPAPPHPNPLPAPRSSAGRGRTVSEGPASSRKWSQRFVHLAGDRGDSPGVRPRPAKPGEGGGEGSAGVFARCSSIPNRMVDPAGPQRALPVAGSARWKVAPASGLAVAQSWPPWRSTMARLIERPMPRPPGLVVWKASNRREGKFQRRCRRSWRRWRARTATPPPVSGPIRRGAGAFACPTARGPS